MKTRGPADVIPRAAPREPAGRDGRDDRATADRAAAAINSYWRSRGREVHARVGAHFEIVSDLSSPASRARAQEKPPPQERRRSADIDAAILSALRAAGDDGLTRAQAALQTECAFQSAQAALARLNRAGRAARWREADCSLEKWRAL